MPGPGTSATAIPVDPLSGGPSLPGPVLLDITRSLSRIDRETPSGIDRVEAAWIAHLAERGDTCFVAAVPRGTVWLDRASGLRVLAEGARAPLDLRGRLSRRPEAVRRAASLARALGRRGLPPSPGGLYANVGHANLTGPGMAALGRAGLRRVVMIHDTIPLDHPGLASPGSVPRFAARLRAAAAADLILTPSRHSAERVAHWLRAWGVPAPRIEAVPLGIEPPAMAWAPAAEPSFVVLGTIEPRKGHDLLLDVWERLGPDAPRLHVVGRRGWASPGLLARLDTPPPGVVVHGPLPDPKVQTLLAAARALLMPSLAEGFGLPAAEARAMGLPAILSDLPALREVAGGHATFLPCGDRAAWAEAIRSMDNRPGLHAALTIRKTPAFSLWNGHFARVAGFLT
jgi:glycosyltransferase involved in cell wall biosynthesis